MTATLAPAVRGVVTDPAMPRLAEALDPERAGRAIEAAGVFRGARTRVDDVRLLRHKPGKRCLVEYDIVVRWPDGRREHVTAIGKMRAGHRPRTGVRILTAFWKTGFDADSADGISVPEPLGVVPSLDVWLQRRVPGVVATAVLTTPSGPSIAGRIADAARKVHAAGVRPRRVHGMADEMRILERVLGDVAKCRPEWRTRLSVLTDGCRRIASRLEARIAVLGHAAAASTSAVSDQGAVTHVGVCGIHRDFYGDQVLVDGDRLWLIDFDLYCEGPAAVDVGNFLGHLWEQAVREPQHADALAIAAAALEDRSAALAGEGTRWGVRACAALTLARHVYLSTVVPGRSDATARLLELAAAHVAAQAGERA